MSCSSRIRNRGEAKFYDLQKFPERDPISMPFESNVNDFISKFMVYDDYKVLGIESWCCILYNTQGITIPLLIFKEDVETSPREPECYHCRYAGWGGRMLSRKRYHFVIRQPQKSKKPIDADVFECKDHILHGIIHGSGFGHLVSINGLEGGSEHIRGDEIMDLWERMCLSLRTRDISLVDSAKKMGFDFRLLSAISDGLNWFSKWGYCCAALDTYTAAVAGIRSLSLDSDGMKASPEVVKICRNYPVTDHIKLVGQMFKHLLKLYHDTPSSEAGSSSSARHSYPKFNEKISSFEERKFRQCMQIARNIVTTLETEKRNNGVGRLTRSFFYDRVTRSHMLDSVLAQLPETSLEGYVILRTREKNGAYEYFVVEDDAKAAIYRDLTHLYNHILNLTGVSQHVSNVLEMQLLIRTSNVTLYNTADNNSYLCKFRYGDLDLCSEGMLVIPPRNQTAGELKSMIQETFRQNYHPMRDIVLSRLEGFQDDDDAINMRNPAVGPTINPAVAPAVVPAFDPVVDFPSPLDPSDIAFVADLLEIPENPPWITVHGSLPELVNTPYDMVQEGGWLYCHVCKSKTMTHGESLIKCDGCKRWGHKLCNGFGDHRNVPGFLCSACRPPVT